MAKKNRENPFFNSLAAAVENGDSSKALDLDKKERVNKTTQELYEEELLLAERETPTHTPQIQKRGIGKMERFNDSIRIGSVTITPDQLNEVNFKTLEINDKKCNVRIHQEHDHVLNLLSQNLRYRHNLPKSAINKTALVYLILEAALKEVEK
jgi:hypothetical protein